MGLCLVHGPGWPPRVPFWRWHAIGPGPVGGMAPAMGDGWESSPPSSLPALGKTSSSTGGLPMVVAHTCPLQMYQQVGADGVHGLALDRTSPIKVPYAVLDGGVPVCPGVPAIPH